MSDIDDLDPNRLHGGNPIEEPTPMPTELAPKRRNVFDGFETQKDLPTGDLRNDPPALVVWGGDPNKILLEMRVVDGKLTAYYDEEDLDEGARRFVDEVLKVNKEMDGG